MQYAVTVIIESDNLKSAIMKVPDDLGEVVGAIPRPQQQPGQIQGSGQVITGAFQNTQTQATPQLKKS